MLCPHRTASGDCQEMLQMWREVMSLGSGAERFLFIFNLHPCPYPTPLPVHHPFLLMALETNRLSSDTLCRNT